MVLPSEHLFIVSKSITFLPSFSIVESLGEKAGLGLLIFAAIMCHKAPASFGFGTVLVQNNLSVCSYAKHLGAFTGSSPIVNLLVYFGLAMTQNGSTDLLAL